MLPPIHRLHLASLRGLDHREWPVHGFLVLHPDLGPVLVDTGVGGPERWLTDWRVVNRSVADALAEHDLIPDDITLVINTHLHFDHCGQNSVFRHAPFCVQRVELERARRESPALVDWFDFAGARFELLDGDTEIASGLRLVATPGHTTGHQCVLVSGADAGEGTQLLIGDAAYTRSIYTNPDPERIVAGQAADPMAWRASLERLRAIGPEAVHFCHDTSIHHG